MLIKFVNDEEISLFNSDLPGTGLFVLLYTTPQVWHLKGRLIYSVRQCSTEAYLLAFEMANKSLHLQSEGKNFLVFVMPNGRSILPCLVEANLLCSSLFVGAQRLICSALNCSTGVSFTISDSVQNDFLCTDQPSQ